MSSVPSSTDAHITYSPLFFIANEVIYIHMGYVVVCIWCVVCFFVCVPLSFSSYTVPDAICAHGG